MLSKLKTPFSKPGLTCSLAKPQKQGFDVMGDEPRERGRAIAAERNRSHDTVSGAIRIKD